MVRIERFQQSDSDDVAALCAAENWPSFTPQNVAVALRAPGVIALVARDDGELVGVAQLLTDGAVAGYLALLVVSRHARRRGVGRSLIEELFACCDLSRIDLFSEVEAAPFYESLPHHVMPGYRIYPAD